MTRRLLSITTAALLATPAFADITPEEAWAMMKAQTEAAGFSVTVGRQARDGDVLTLSNVSAKAEIADASLDTHIDTIQFVDIGQGEVLVSHSDIPFALTLAMEDGDVSMTGRIEAPGSETILKGDPGALAGRFSLPHLGVHLDNVFSNGERLDLDLSVIMKETEGTYETRDADGPDGFPTLAAQYTTHLMMLSGDITPPTQGGGTLSFNGSARNLAFDSEGLLLPMDVVAVPDGLTSRSRMTYEAGEITYRFAMPQGAADTTITAARGAVDTGVQDGRMYYRGETRDIGIGVTSNVMPLPPIDITIAQTNTRLLIPVLPSRDENEVGLATRVDGLQISDMLWSILDPLAALPHDPLTFELAVTGQGKLAVDAFNPKMDMDGLSGKVVDLSSVALDSFVLSALGAQITATGAARNMETDRDLPPRMAGQFVAQGRGLQMLIGNLGRGGMLPQDMAMMANMVLAMFAVPGTEPDTHSTTIEVTAQGQVVVNGRDVR